MISAEPSAAPEHGLVTELRLAAGFLTILPLMPPAPADEAAVANSLRWFPLVGFVLGATACGFDFLVGRVFGTLVRSMLTIAAVSAVTGAVHLDALADTADALGAGGDRERALEILRDSHIGSFGAVALFFVLALKVAALASLAGSARYVALYVALGVSRWAQVAVADKLNYLRATGAGSALLGRGSVRIASIVTALALTPALIPSRTVAAIAVASLMVLALRFAYRRWLGGVTGDLIGACSELVEVAVLLAFT